MIENFSYGLQDQIGKGFSSKVFKGKNETTQELVAVKVIDLQMLKTPLHHSLLKSEIEALSLLNHPNIMKLFKVP
jgi:SNF-related kinase